MSASDHNDDVKSATSPDTNRDNIVSVSNSSNVITDKHENSSSSKSSHTQPMSDPELMKMLNKITDDTVSSHLQELNRQVTHDILNYYWTCAAFECTEEIPLIISGGALAGGIAQQRSPLGLLDKQYQDVVDKRIAEVKKCMYQHFFDATCYGPLYTRSMMKFDDQYITGFASIWQRLNMILEYFHDSKFKSPYEKYIAACEARWVLFVKWRIGPKEECQPEDSDK